MINFCSLSVPAQNFLSCPRFTEGREDSIKLTVTKSAFSSPTPCFQPPTSVVFYFQPKNEGRAIWCTTSYKECPNTGQPLPACRNCACGCENDDVNTTVLSMHFTPSAAHLGGTFSSEVNCIHTVNTPLQTNENCAPISLGKLITSNYYYYYVFVGERGVREAGWKHE